MLIGFELQKSRLDFEKEITQLLSEVICAFFNSLADEEVLMKKFRISHSHLALHQREHIAYVKNIINAALKSVSTKKDRILQHINMWLLDHVKRFDHDLSTIISSKLSIDEVFFLSFFSFILIYSFSIVYYSEF
jgi:hemerythrin